VAEVGREIRGNVRAKEHPYESIDISPRELARIPLRLSESFLKGPFEDTGFADVNLETLEFDVPVTRAIAEVQIASP
jgi:hypothetical protein